MKLLFLTVLLVSVQNTFAAYHPGYVWHQARGVPGIIRSITVIPMENRSFEIVLGLENPNRIRRETIFINNFNAEFSRLIFQIEPNFSTSIISSLLDQVRTLD